MTYHHQDFDPVKLVDVLAEVIQKIPGCTVGRSREGTGNLCIYDRGEYVGVIELHKEPEWFAYDDVED